MLNKTIEIVVGQGVNGTGSLRIRCVVCGESLEHERKQTAWDWLTVHARDCGSHA